eukprot:92903_1
MTWLLPINNTPKLITDYTNWIIAYWVRDNQKFPKDLYPTISKYFRLIVIFGEMKYKSNSKEILQIIKMSQAAEKYDDMAQLMIVYLQYIEYDNINYGFWAYDRTIQYKRSFVLLDCEARDLMKVAFDNVIQSRKDSYQKLVDKNQNKTETHNEYLQSMKSEILNIYSTV